MRYSLIDIQISTRDGTMAKDSLARNVLSGQKRPGLELVRQLPVGVGQGLIQSPTLGPLAIIANSIYSVTTGALIAAIPSGVGPYDFVKPVSSGLIAFKDATNMWTLLDTVVTQMTAAPTNMLPGFVFLDGTYYVMTAEGKIHGSGLNDLTTWDPLNMLVLNAELGTPVCIAKQLNYVVGVAQNFCMFYYDAGNPPPGSPLSPAQNTYMNLGCTTAGSVAQIGNLSLFIGTNATSGRSAFSFLNMQPQIISNVAVDKILKESDLSDVSALALKIAGNDVYLLTLRDINTTLILDFNSKQWLVWSSSTSSMPDPVVQNSYQQSYFLPKYYLQQPVNDLFLHESNGKVYTMLPTIWQDDGLPIDVQYITKQLEGETSDYQRIASAEIVGDKVDSKAYIRFTDDDYSHWSSYREVDLLQTRSQTVRQGATRRRAYQIRHTANTPLNLRELLLRI